VLGRVRGVLPPILLPPILPPVLRPLLRPLLLLALLGALASLPLWAPRFWIYVGTQALIFAIFAMSLDLLLGYAGLASFGHAAFYGVGAYACALLALRHVDGLLPLLLVGALASAAVAVPIGALSLRTTGIYFLMLTLAFAQMLWGLAVNWTSLTRGTDGLIGIPRPTLPGADALGFTLYERGPFFIVCLVIAVLVVLIGQGVFPGWMVAAIVAREFLVSGLRLAALERGVVIHARDLGKLKTWAQAVAAAVGGFAAAGAWTDRAAWWTLLVALVLTWVSGLDYARVAPRLLRGRASA